MSSLSMNNLESSGSNAFVKSFANLTDPFEPHNKDYAWEQIDPRVPILSQLCRSLWDECGNEYEWYELTLKLWLSIESKTKFEPYPTLSERLNSRAGSAKIWNGFPLELFKN